MKAKLDECQHRQVECNAIKLKWAMKKTLQSKKIKKYNPNNVEYKLICNEHKLLWTEARFHHWIQNKKGSYDYLSHNYFFLVCYKVRTVWYEHKIAGEKKLIKSQFWQIKSKLWDINSQLFFSELWDVNSQLGVIK